MHGSSLLPHWCALALVAAFVDHDPLIYVLWVAVIVILSQLQYVFQFTVRLPAVAIDECTLSR
jgi:hypothetical protein